MKGLCPECRTIHKLTDACPIVDLHNQLAGKVVTLIVKPLLDNDGDTKDVLVLLESVVTGVILTITKLGGDEIVIDTLIEGIKARLAKDRLTNHETVGEA